MPSQSEINHATGLDLLHDFTKRLHRSIHPILLAGSGKEWKGDGCDGIWWYVVTVMMMMIYDDMMKWYMIIWWNVLARPRKLPNQCQTRNCTWHLWIHWGSPKRTGPLWHQGSMIRLHRRGKPHQLEQWLPQRPQGRASACLQCQAKQRCTQSIADSTESFLSHGHGTSAQRTPCSLVHLGTRNPRRRWLQRADQLRFHLEVALVLLALQLQSNGRTPSQSAAIQRHEPGQWAIQSWHHVAAPGSRPQGCTTSSAVVLQEMECQPLAARAGILEASSPSVLHGSSTCRAGKSWQATALSWKPPACHFGCSLWCPSWCKPSRHSHHRRCNWPGKWAWNPPSLRIFKQNEGEEKRMRTSKEIWYEMTCYLLYYDINIWWWWWWGWWWWWWWCLKMLLRQSHQCSSTNIRKARNILLSKLAR